MSMTTSPAGGISGGRPAVWPLIVAIIAAAAIGGMVAGAEVAVVAGLGALIVSLLPRIIMIAGHGGVGAFAIAGRVMYTAGRIGGIAIALPGLFVTSLVWLIIGLPAALARTAHARAASTGIQPAPLPTLPDLAAAGRLGQRAKSRGISFLKGMVSERGLPLLLANLLLALVIGCVLLGMGVALYAALIAVPVMIATMMLVAVDGSDEPEVPSAGNTQH